MPELPGRGPGAGMLGRTLALLPDLYADLQPRGWRFVPRSGVDHRRALDLVARDLDAVEQALDGYAGPLKAQLAGPWTLVAGVELHRGDRALADPVAARDVAQALAEAAAGHVAELRRRVPGATVLLQLDEPSLPAVRDGRLRTASGFGRVAAVPEPDLTAALREVVGAAGAPTGVHCCAAGPPWGVLTGAGAAYLGVDASLLGTRDYDALGQAVESGTMLFLGLVPATGDTAPAARDVAAAARRLWRSLGLPPATLPERVVVTPACGLAGATPGYARSALRAARDAGRMLAEDPEDG